MIPISSCMDCRNPFVLPACPRKNTSLLQCPGTHCQNMVRFKGLCCSRTFVPVRDLILLLQLCCCRSYLLGFQLSSFAVQSRSPGFPFCCAHSIACCSYPNIHLADIGNYPVTRREAFHTRGRDCHLACLSVANTKLARCLSTPTKDTSSSALADFGVLARK